MKLTLWPMKSKGEVPGTAYLQDLDELIERSSQHIGYVEVTQREKDNLPMIQGIEWNSRLCTTSASEAKLNAYLHWNGFLGIDFDSDEKEKPVEFSDDTLKLILKDLSCYSWVKCISRSTGGGGIHVWTVCNPVVNEEFRKNKYNKEWLDRNNLDDLLDMATCNFNSYSEHVKKVVSDVVEKYNLRMHADTAMDKPSQGIHLNLFYKYVNPNFKLQDYGCTKCSVVVKHYADVNEEELAAVRARTSIGQSVKKTLELRHPERLKLASTIKYYLGETQEAFELFSSLCSIHKSVHRAEFNDSQPWRCNLYAKFLISNKYIK